MKYYNVAFRLHKTDNKKNNIMNMTSAYNNKRVANITKRNNFLTSSACKKEHSKKNCRCCKRHGGKNTAPSLSDDSVGLPFNVGSSEIPIISNAPKDCRSVGDNLEWEELPTNPNICCKKTSMDENGCTNSKDLCGINGTSALCKNDISNCEIHNVPDQQSNVVVKWDDDLAYFLSGGDDSNGDFVPYTENQLLYITPTNPKRTGADPSCGSKDFKTLAMCFFGIALNDSLTEVQGADARQSFQYPAYDFSHVMQYNLDRVGVSSPTATNNDKVCGTCMEDANGICYTESDPNTCTEKSCAGDATVQLINPGTGKVPAIAHGHFGPIANAKCSTNAYAKGIDIDLFNKKVNTLATIMSYGNIIPEYIKYYKTSDYGNVVVLITKQVYIDSGLENFYNSLTPDGNGPSNDGVGLAWGHGVGGGSCGDVAYLRQGSIEGWPDENGNPVSDNVNTKNNVMLLFQNGTRSWSGEWTDSIGSQENFLDYENCVNGEICNKFKPSATFRHDLGGNHAAYIVEGVPFAKQDATCLQPHILEMPVDHLPMLLNTICAKLKSKGFNCESPKEFGFCACRDDAESCNAAACSSHNNTNKLTCTTEWVGGCGKWTKTDSWAGDAQRVCSCENGTAAQGNDCTNRDLNSANACVTCNSGYDLSNNKCIQVNCSLYKTKEECRNTSCNWGSWNPSDPCICSKYGSNTCSNDSDGGGDGEGNGDGGGGGGGDGGGGGNGGTADVGDACVPNHCGNDDTTSTCCKDGLTCSSTLDGWICVSS